MQLIQLKTNWRENPSIDSEVEISDNDPALIDFENIY